MRGDLDGPWSDAVRRRVAAVALTVVLFALVAVWSGAELEGPRPRARAPRPRRGRSPLRTPVVACETIAAGRVYRLDLSACPPSPRRLRRFRPAPPRPCDLN